MDQGNSSLSSKDLISPNLIINNSIKTDQKSKYRPLTSFAPNSKENSQIRRSYKAKHDLNNLIEK